MTWVLSYGFWSNALLIILLALAAGSLVAIAVGIFKARHRFRLLLYGFLTLLTVFVIFNCVTFQSAPPSPEFESKKNLVFVKEMLDRYAKDHDGEYPANVNDLITSHTVDMFPQNPFTRAAIRDIPFHSEPFEGEFTYVQVSREGKVVGYYLLLYGRKENEGTDVNDDGVRDHVIMVLDSETAEAVPDSPTLADLLKNPAGNPQ